MKKRCRAIRRNRSIRFKANPDGTQDVTILFRNVRLQSDAEGRMWWMISYEGNLPQHVVCGRAKLKPKLVVKLYCKMPEAKMETLKKLRVLESIRSNSPLVLT